MPAATDTEIAARRTVAIISHPDAGKTTLTEQLLHYGGAIQTTGTVKARKSNRYATSDWMALEQQRGISVTSSVMQFPYRTRIINLLDTPGHADFSEDTYRTLTAVDSVLMVIDSAKGVEARTKQLMEVCRMRATPIMTFINKMDRDGREPIVLLDDIEQVLKIQCAPMTWPIGSGRAFTGIYRLYDDTVELFAGRGGVEQAAVDSEVAANAPTDEKAKAQSNARLITGLASAQVTDTISEVEELREEIELLRAASHTFNPAAYLSGQQTPVFFGSALHGHGTQALMDMFVDHAPSPQPRTTVTREVGVHEPQFSGFVFKIQANMDPAHHDRVAFVRITSGRFEKGMKIHHVRSGKSRAIHNAHTFMAGRRGATDCAWAGDIIGLPNHGNIQIGDTFTAGEALKFTGIPNFAPELFRRVRLADPLAAKALHKGLAQLCEEGATQLFKPLLGNELILGAIGILQFDVVAHRLQHEYGVDCRFEAVGVVAARWLVFTDATAERAFRGAHEQHLAIDAQSALAYIAPNRANLQLAMQNWPQVEFRTTREL